MKPLDNDEGFILSTGKKFYANCRIIGISPPGEDGKIVGISQGYDGGIYTKFTKKEKLEIAVYMKNLWMDWAQE